MEAIYFHAARDVAGEVTQLGLVVGNVGDTDGMGEEMGIEHFGVVGTVADRDYFVGRYFGKLCV